ncbi:MAG TPA: NAD(P)-binding domain-containing protein [Miltoncostaeaceae bacterium]|nr:NAD(P)-binding domain-containing protein [Miltoncostaeaceae bacterium]
MRVAVIGAGRIGGNVARLLVAAGHRVTVSGRDSERLRRRAEETGALPAPAADAVRDAEVVVVAVPWDALPEAIAGMGPLDGRILIDTTNQFGSGPKPAPGETAAAFNVARMPGARYTKCFNTLTSAFQELTAHRDPPVVQWICGDDDEAVEVVAGLVRDAGFAPVALGGTRDCAVMEAPRREGAVYGEEYRPAEAREVAAAVAAGRPIPPAPAYG